MLADLESVDLIRGYVDLKGKPFLLIPRFFERPRSKSRFSEPPEEVTTEQGCTHLFADACKCNHPTSTSTTIPTSNTTKSVAQEPAAPALPRRAKPITAETWAAYSVAYSSKYGTEPTRNARVNGQLAQFVGLVPTEEAPAIAAFYVSVNKPYYVSQRHPVGMLVKDAEGLRTQWLTGNVATGLEVQPSKTASALMSLERFKNGSPNIQCRDDERVSEVAGFIPAKHASG